MKLYTRIITTFCLILAASSAIAADADSVRIDSITQKNGFFHRFYRYFADANEDKTTTKKFDFSVIGGPHFSSDTKFGIGLVAAGLYRIDKNDLTIPPSNISLYGDVSTTGFFLLGVRGNNLFKSDRYRLDYSTYFFSFPSQFWGIGYHDATHNEATTYKRLQAQVKVDFMFRIARNTYLGPNINFSYVEGKNFTDQSFLDGQKSKYVNMGLGGSIVYDSRDILVNAYKGMYLKLDQRFFPEFMGNDNYFSRTEVFADFYQRLWKGGVLAYDLHGLFTSKDTPWTMIALMGGSYRMRGYYEGRYRDKNLIETQLELRQRVWRRIGVTTWVGAGNVFPSFDRFKWEQTLPNYGVGLRWEFKNRVNVRLDYGFGKDGQQGFIFNINEAF